jgi:hypothetical protein
MIRVFICILVVIILIIILFQTNSKNKITETMTESSIVTKIISSYWNQYQPTDKRSKCFDCDKAENY